MRDVLTIQAGSMSFMAAGFIASIVFARVLGADQYGLYAVTLAFAGTVTQFLNIGQGQSLYVFFSEAYAKKDRRAMAAVIKNFLWIAGANVILLGVLTALIPTLGTWLYGPSEIGKLAQLLCLFQITDLWNSANLILMQSVRRVRLKVMLEQGQNLSYLALAVILLFAGYGVKGIFIAQLSVSVCFLFISIVALKDTAKKYVLPGVREVLRIPWRESEQYFVQGLVITLDKSIGNFFPQGLFFIFSLFVSQATVGITKIAVTLAMIPKNILLPQAGDLSVTAFAKLKSQGREAVRKGAEKLISHAFAFQTFMTFGAIIGFPIIIHFFYGPEYAKAIPVSIVLLLIMLLQSFCIANSPILRLYRKMHLSIIAGILSWTLMITVMVTTIRFLSPNYSFVLTFLTGTLVTVGLARFTFTKVLKNA